ncbi:MAG: hypothetical protein M9905_12180 [Rhizobiaceae bacterium]|nr:hypothetical protein [Rhizobiaceae bacterium]
MTPERIRLRRSEVPQYLMEKHGLPVAVQTLAKWASIGGGPAMRYHGRFPLYDIEDLDAWAAERLSAPVRSTAERSAA